MTKGTVEKIYSEYKSQVDKITEIMNYNYRKAAVIIAWLYGGSAERWRKVLAAGKKEKTPKAVEEFLNKFQKK